MGVLADIHASSAYRGLILWIIYFPIACSLVSAIWAGPIAAIEGASFSDAFHWQLQTFTTAALPLTSWGGPTGTAGIILCNITAVFHQIILAIFVGLTAGPVIEPLLGIGAGVCGDSDGSMMVARTFGGFLKKIFLLYVCIALLGLLCSVLLGGLLSAAEGWPFEDGFVLTLGSITSSLTVLPGTPVAETTAGIVVGFYTGMISAAFLGLIIAVASVPLLGVDLSYDNSPVVLAAPMLLLSAAQRKRLGIADGCLARKGSATLTSIPTMPKGAAPASTTVEMTGDAAEQRA